MEAPEKPKKRKPRTQMTKKPKGSVAVVSNNSCKWTQKETQSRQIISHKKAGLNARQLNRTQNVYVEVCIP